MASAPGHLSDDELVDPDRRDESDAGRVRAHLHACAACRERRSELVRLRELLAQAGRREGRPPHDAVPSAMLRLRLRRHGITNANELLAGFAAFVRGFASLFSLPATQSYRAERARGAEDDHLE